MRIQPSARIATLPTGIFSDLAARKRQAAARGIPIVDLSVGSPDLSPPPIVTHTLATAVKDPANYGYTLTALPGFNEAVALFYQHRYSVSLQPETEVLQLMGSQDGLSHLALALLNPGDVVLAPDPGYPIYAASVAIAGGEVVPMPLRSENGFLPDLSAIPEATLRRAKLMILNFPGNPVGALAPPSFFAELVALANRFDMLLVHDFAYSELVFDGRRAASLLSVPGATDVAIEFNSLSKTFNMAGCRIGYVVGNREVLQWLARLKSHIDYGVFAPIQMAAIAVLTGHHDGMFRDQVRVYEQRRDALVHGLSTAGWSVPRTPATMFVWAPIPQGFSTSQQFALDLLEATGVVVTPGDAFGQEGEGYVRIALVQPEAVLAQIAPRVRAFLRDR